MSKCQYAARCMVVLGLLVAVPTAARGDLLVASSLVRADASAGVAGNPFVPADSHTDFHGTPGPYSGVALANRTSEIQPNISSAVSSSAVSTMADDGLSGFVVLSTTWTSLSTLSQGDINNSGDYGSTTRFLLSFLDISDTFTINIDITSTYSSPTVGTFADDTMALNHAVVFSKIGDVNSTDLPISGFTHLDYTRSDGFGSYQLQLDQNPNAGMSPWPNGTRTATTTMTFTIIPEPASALLLALGCMPIMARRRRVR